VKVVFALHNHQPIGNLDQVVAAATSEAYLPFLSALEEAPEATRAVVHNSGPLWEWWLAHQPDAAARFAESERIEMLGGGWYEPVLAAIPENDRVEQLALGQTRLQELTGDLPRGVWLGERWWDPSLAGTLHRHDIAYTLLDGENLPPELPATRPYTLEYHGRTITAFFISQTLRHAIPDSPVDDVIALLERYAAQDPSGVMVFADDGEKLGHWSNSYSAGWLRRFFSEIARHDRLELTTLADAYAAVPSGGHLALGPCSYSEMMDWSGGHWQQLGYKRHESAILLRRMEHMSRLLRRSSEDARRHLLRSQCNDAYWHGAFGGSRIPYLRSAISAELISARVAHDPRRSGWAETEMIDWRADGQLDLYVELPNQSWVAAADRAGLYYFDDKPSVWPLTDVAWPDYHVLAFEDRWEAGPAPTYAMAEPVAGRGEVTVTFTSEHVDKTLKAAGRRIDVTYQLNDAPKGRFGPLFPLAIDSEAVMRIDGGVNVGVSEAGTFDGHRFRLTAGDGQRQILISLPVPGRLELSPLTTVHTDQSGDSKTTHQGVLLWLSYPTVGSGTYSFNIEVMN